MNKMQEGWFVFANVLVKNEVRHDTNAPPPNSAEEFIETESPLAPPQ